MHVKNIKFNPEGQFELLLSEQIKGNESICFCERIEADIWDIHYRNFPCLSKGNDVYLFDSSAILKTFEFGYEKTFDLCVVDSSGYKAKPLCIELEKSFVDEFKNETTVAVGSIVCQYYKSGNGRLSMKARLVNKNVYEISAENKDEQGVSLNLRSDFSGEVEWLFARRSVSDNTMRFDKFYPLVFSEPKKTTNIIIKRSDPLYNLLQGGGEHWELVAKVQGILFKTTTTDKFETEVFEANDAARACICASPGTSLSIDTYENNNKSQRKIKVAVIGTCFSRQAFNSKNFFNPDYKRFYDCGLTAYHLSIPSMLSKPIDVDKAKLTGTFQPDLNVHGESHFNKDFIRRLAEYKPDYLIIENYVHISAALIETADGSYIDENYYLVDTPAFKELKVKERIPAESEKHFELYKKSLEAFKKLLSDIMPEKNIVIVRTQPALNKIEDGVLKVWESAQSIKFRRYIWERYDSHFISQFPRARVIDMRNEKYVSEKSAHFKFAPSHFGSAYYKDLLYHFNKIALQDLLK